MRFTLPRDLYHGKDALEALKTLTGKKAIVVVGGGSMKRFGFLDKVVDYLKEAGMEVKLFEGVEPDPSVDTVLKGAAAMQEFEPDWIVAVGGGSPPCVPRLNSVRFPPHQEQQLRLPHFPLLLIIRKASNIPWPTSTSHLMWLSWTRPWLRPCQGS